MRSLCPRAVAHVNHGNVRFGRQYRNIRTAPRSLHRPCVNTVYRQVAARFRVSSTVTLYNTLTASWPQHQLTTGSGGPQPSLSTCTRVIPEGVFSASSSSSQAQSPRAVVDAPPLLFVLVTGSGLLASSEEVVPVVRCN